MPKYYGPYKVLQKTGIMGYKLELLSSSWVHPVFHVSCLTKVIGENIPVQTILPELDEEGKIILEPEAVTEKRTRQLQNQSISEYLINYELTYWIFYMGGCEFYTEAPRATQALRTTLFWRRGAF